MGRADRLRMVLGIACWVVAGCGSPTDEAAPSHTVTSSAGASPTHAPKPPAKAPPGDTPAKVTAPIRDASAPGEVKDGAALAARLFLSRIASGDAVGVAFELVPAQPPTRPDPWDAEMLDHAQILSGLRFEIEGPGGKRVLETAGPLGRSSKNALSWTLTDLRLDAEGVQRSTERVAWKAPAPKLFEAPGNYTLVVSGAIKTDKRSIPVQSGRLAFEVVPADAQLPLAKLEAAAAEIAKTKKGLSALPKPSAPAVDDVEGNVWFRFSLREPPRDNEVEVVEILVDTKGQELNFDDFVHFNCLAEGTRVSTPDGDVAIQTLRVGDPVVAFDVVSGTKTVAPIERVASAHTERTLEVGPLRVTEHHPIRVDGAWRAAGEVAAGDLLTTIDGRHVLVSEPTIVEAPTTVYTLTVGPPHTYFAEGVLVHNKAAYVEIGGNQQPWRGWFWRRAAKR